jgi:hypothetical protein
MVSPESGVGRACQRFSVQGLSMMCYESHAPMREPSLALRPDTVPSPQAPLGPPALHAPLDPTRPRLVRAPSDSFWLCFEDTVGKAHARIRKLAANL